MNVCRVCLATVTGERSINNKIIEVFEKLTSDRLLKDGRSQTICYICVSQLRRCCRLIELYHKSNKIFAELFYNGIALTQDTVSLLNKGITRALLVGPMVSTSTPKRVEDLKIEEFNVKQETIETTPKDALKDNSSRMFKPKTKQKKNTLSSIQLKHSNDNRKITTKQIKHSIACDICGRKYTDKWQLKNHLKSHSEDKPYYKCDLCVKTYGNKYHLARHIMTHNEEKPYVCDVCGKKLTDPSTLKRHMSNHTGLKPLSCADCEKTFCDQYTLNQHKQCHSGHAYVCNGCSKTFPRKQSLALHIKRYNGEKPHPCKLCPRTFFGTGSLKRHMETHKVRCERLCYSCKYCHRKYARKESLSSHLKSHTEGISCDVCGKAFASTYSLACHMKTHETREQISCSVCNKSVFKTALANHMKIHNGGNEKRFICNLCDKAFKEKRSLVIHMRTHTGDRPFSCDKCTKTFHDSQNFRRHIKNVHGEYQYACNSCDRRFKRSLDLKTHKLMHAGKAVVCGLCARAFTQKTNLVRHLNKIHIGQF